MFICNHILSTWKGGVILHHRGDLDSSVLTLSGIRVAYHTQLQER